MSNQHTAFIGSIPENYDRYLGSVLFDPFASDIVNRLDVSEGASVLELACGTGIVTRRLRDRLLHNVKLIATDLNEAMIAYAAGKFVPNELVEWKQADATNLPFADGSFDAVVCQFGLMFVPDKQMAFREAHRVLKPEGKFLFSVWDAIEENDLAYIAHKTISTFFENDPPNFYEIPFSFHDPEAIKLLLAEVGFKEIELTLLKLRSICHSALEVATGLVKGNPVIVAINERNPSAVAKVISAVAEAVALHCGDLPVRGKMQAFVCSAIR
jgi:ubiquinone/menaquinone biosynthesis C-methylase UbiE